MKVVHRSTRAVLLLRSLDPTDPMLTAIDAGIIFTCDDGRVIVHHGIGLTVVSYGPHPRLLVMVTESYPNQN
jgi:hypothetical protein